MEVEVFEEGKLLEVRPIKRIFQYTGEILHVYDKNKIGINIDLGFATWRRVPCTLAYIHVPEDKGKDFQKFMNKEFESNNKVLIRGLGFDFGSDLYSCELFSANEFPERFYNNLVIKEGIARAIKYH